jgi:RNA polymerase sigma factor (TIGR02999 family)
MAKEAISFYSAAWGVAAVAGGNALKRASVSMSEVTRMLGRIEPGDPAVAEQLLLAVYDELRKLAAARLAHEKPGQTLSATALVHEAYLRLVDTSQPQAWNSRGHFFAAAAEAMQRILVERARQKRGPRRGGMHARVALDQAVDMADQQANVILSVSEALDDLAKESQVKADLVKLRYFAGLSHQDAAAALGISRATADRHWAYAKAFLYSALQDDG